jgi:hypothetical protein
MHCFFAKIENDIVVNLIVIDEEAMLDEDGIQREELGAAFCNGLDPGEWIQSWPTGEKRKWYGGVGFSYRRDLDAFVPPKPPVECTLDEELCHWIDENGRDLNIPPPPEPR